ncbi:hypothetical protein [Roseibacillus persicicus]|uniref:hypothetical protein n=1 Tax=Roseibacillus persicicus TaxID=454148 RepID=UPI00280DCB6C|nr:hypothetical protein [Roseibacillus persicicus]MDQ8191574.1 hypothetical protein [Roseibacillus persicicus]
MKKGNQRRSAAKASHPAPKSPSWAVEREAIRLYSDRVSRAILAVYHARRTAQSEEFFVAPQIAKLNRLSPADLNWALDKLEGKVMTTVSSKKGRWRTIRLLPHLEKGVMAPGKQSHHGEGMEGALQPDEERLSYDKETVLNLAFSSDGETSAEVLEALNIIAAQAEY